MKRFLAILLLAACTKKPIVVGSKNFTESVILGELVAQKLESSGCKVDRRMNLGGSLVGDAAIASGSPDTYVGDSGTARPAVLRHPLQQPLPAATRPCTRPYPTAGPPRAPTREAT